MLKLASKIMNKMSSKQGRADLRFFISRNFINPILRPLGFTLIADHFYQPIPNPKEAVLYANTTRPTDAIEYDLDEQIAFVQDLLETYKTEFNAAADLCAVGYKMHYGGFGSGDAEMLYSVVRHLKPRRIIEVGAGTSTQVILAALRKNKNSSGVTTRCRLTSIDPYPSKEVLSLPSEIAEYADHEVVASRVQDVALDLFKSLGVGDILFVDSSHVFKPGSDVEHEFLRIYPVVSAGAWIHIHDIFMPFDYPTSWNTKECFFWNEQYFLEVFLQFNNTFKARAMLNMIARARPEIFVNVIDRYKPDRMPGSFWMQRVELP